MTPSWPSTAASPHPSAPSVNRSSRSPPASSATPGVSPAPPPMRTMSTPSASWIRPTPKAPTTWSSPKPAPLPPTSSCATPSPTPALTSKKSVISTVPASTNNASSAASCRTTSSSTSCRRIVSIWKRTRAPPRRKRSPPQMGPFCRLPSLPPSASISTVNSTPKSSIPPPPGSLPTRHTHRYRSWTPIGPIKSVSSRLVLDHLHSTCVWSPKVRYHRWRMIRLVTSCAAALALGALALSAQDVKTPSEIAKFVNVNPAEKSDWPPKGPAPKRADGKPDINGAWAPNAIKANVDLISTGVDVPFQPWAQKLYLERKLSLSKDDPEALCLPPGVPRMSTTPYPFRITEGPGGTSIL